MPAETPLPDRAGGPDELSPERQRDEWVQRLRALWSAGEKDVARAELRRLAASEPTFPFLADLAYFELTLRRESGELPALEEYLRELPTLAADLRALHEMDELLPPSSPCSQFGSFELQEEIGRGGMGVVYKAIQKSLHRPVALKVLSAGWFATDEQRQRFRTEAEAIALFQHPNIVGVIEGGEQEGQVYLAMEYVDGGSLARHPDGSSRLDGTPWPFLEAGRLVCTVAEAVHVAHKRGILHRDLKPANVLLTRDGTPKVGDFGLARQLDLPVPDSPAREMSGTPSYMAPEQARGEKGIGPVADVYSLGAILYELLTGRPPFLGPTPLETLEMVRTREPLPPSQLQPRVPRDLETICLKCLHKEPAKRYPSAEALAADLGRFLRGEPIRARPTSLLEKGVKWARRHPDVAALIAVVFLILSVGVMLLWAEMNRAQTAEKVSDEKRQQAEQSEKKTVEALEATRVAEKKARTNEELALKREEEAKFQAFRAEDALHAIQIDQALRAWEAGKVEDAERVLDKVAPPFQPMWETMHLRALCRRKARAQIETGSKTRIGMQSFTLPGHTGGSRSVCFSSDGRHIVSGGLDRTVKVWDAGTGQAIRSLEGHQSAVNSVACSSDGRRIVSGSADGALKWWDAETGQELFTRAGHAGGVNSVAWSPDGRRVASAGVDKAVKVWDAQTGQELFSLKKHTSIVRCLAFSPDGKRLVSGDGLTFGKSEVMAPGQIVVWDAETGQEIRTLEGHRGSVISVAFSPDGRRIVSGSQDTSLKVWDAGTGQEIHTLEGDKSMVSSVAYSPDGRRLVSGSDDKVLKVWEPDTGQEKITLRWSFDVVRCIAFSPDGRCIVSASARGPLEMWEVEVSPVAWHEAQAAAWEAAKRWPAAAFHLERLHRSDPSVRPRLDTALAHAEESPLTRSVADNLRAIDAARAAGAVGQPWFTLVVVPPSSPHR
jgi:hypothetical protein